MSLQSPPQLHRPHHLQRGAVRRHCHGLLRARPRHLPQPGRLATVAHRPIQLQVAQRYGAARVQMNATIYANICKKLLHKDKWPFRIERSATEGIFVLSCFLPAQLSHISNTAAAASICGSRMLEHGRCLCSTGLWLCLCSTLNMLCNVG